MTTPISGTFMNNNMMSHVCSFLFIFVFKINISKKMLCDNYIFFSIILNRNYVNVLLIF